MNHHRGRRVTALAGIALILSGCAVPHVVPNGATELRNAFTQRHQTHASYEVLYSFQGGSDGELPVSADAPLTLGEQGVLYGTTSAGYGIGCGTICGNGTVFEVTHLGAEHVLYGFNGKPDGAAPTGPVIGVDGAWYGVTGGGGATDNGAIFTVDNSGDEQIIYSFKGGTDGSLPFGTLTNYGGKLYGTTSFGGANNLGTVYELNRSGRERVRYSFKPGTDGQHPYAGLVAENGTLYGTTGDGGKYGYGTVFAITPTGKERVVYSFEYADDGAAPAAQLTAIGNNLYGTTTDGGGNGLCAGTVFRVSLSGSERVLHRFNWSAGDGCDPASTLLEVNGKLYGTTQLGGSVGDGVIFSITLAGKERVIHNFAGAPDGMYPTGGLAAISDTLYGTTTEGGTGPCYNNLGCGTIFALTLQH